jgi:putative serine protease PepD
VHRSQGGANTPTAPLDTIGVVEWSDWPEDDAGRAVPPPARREWMHPSELPRSAEFDRAAFIEPSYTARPHYGRRATGAVIAIGAAFGFLVLVPLMSKSSRQTAATNDLASEAETSTVLLQGIDLTVSSLTTDPVPAGTAPVASTWSQPITTVKPQPTPKPAPAPTVSSAPKPSTKPTTAAANTTTSTAAQQVTGPPTTVAGVIQFRVTHADGSSRTTSGIRLSSNTVVVAAGPWSATDTADVTTADGKSITATMLGVDRNSTLAVFAVTDDPSAPLARLGSCHDLAVGGSVGVSTMSSASFGVVTDLAMSSEGGPSAPRLHVSSDQRTDQGPVVTRDGAVLALGTSAGGTAAGSATIEAIPADLIRAAAEAVRAGVMTPSRIGLAGVDSKNSDGKNDGGARIVELDPDSPAARAGLEVDDTIVKMGDAAVRSWFDVMLVIRATRPHATLAVTVQALDGTTRTVDVTLDDWT